MDDPASELAALEELAELERRAARAEAARVDVFGRLDYVPTERQRLLHDATEFDVFYGGAAGGGKTKALLMDDLRDCVRNPGVQVYEFRRTYPELRDSFVRELAKVGFARSLGAEWAESKTELRFPNGSVLKMRYAETVKDATRYQSAEMQKLTIDERTLLDPAVVEMLAIRVRSSGGLPVLGIRSGANPGGPGHGPCKARYVTATDYGMRTYTDERGREVRFIPAKIADNPHLNPEYERDLDFLSPTLRAAFKDGDWDTFAGQFFPEWNRDRHVVRPFEIPESWVRRAGIDYGYAAPWAVLWGAEDNDGRVWLYREKYEKRLGEHEQARAILNAEGALTDDGRRALHVAEKVRARLADPSMWAKSRDVQTLAEVYAAEGCHLIPAQNDRLSGWARVHSFLGGENRATEGPACRLHRLQGWETCPLLHVFDTCTELIRTLPALPHDTKKPEDLDTDAEDHAADALRYLLMDLAPPRVGREQVPSTPRGSVAEITAHARKRRSDAQRQGGLWK